MNRISTMLVLGATLASGCSVIVGEQPGSYAAAAPVVASPVRAESGAIWNTSRSLTLFDDLKAAPSSSAQYCCEFDCRRCG